ncbi:TPA: hypothetical protein QC415_002212 [Bacillus cereus]|nr:hypothetical protein [Bacillus cereus]MCG3425704.1 hypothetical protein [Bacillus thuringiensis]MRA98325.1 hypothetical protein [Bacillus thuringiensis]NNG94648.1 hypothetical protein [Bacillus thuringiensis]QWS46259.1 hypothetical protein KPG64_04520 [Bacillus thuringiensis]
MTVLHLLNADPASVHGGHDLLRQPFLSHFFINATTSPEMILLMIATSTSPRYE